MISPIKRIACLLIILSVLPAVLLSGQTADQLYSGGRKAFTDGLWPTASSQFSRLLREYPEDRRADSAAYMAAVAYYNAGEFRRCIDVLSVFPRRYPDSAWNRRVGYWEGLAQYELEKWAEAAAAFERQSTLIEEPAYREQALLYLGACRENLEQWNAAEDAYDLIVEIGRDYETIARAVFRLGQIKLAQGRVDAARDEFIRLAYDFPSSAVSGDTEYWIAECNRSIGRDRDALDGYRNYLVTVYQSPFRSQALLEAARLASEFGEDDEALAYLDLREDERGRTADEHRSTVTRIRGISYLRTGRLREARSAFLAILDDPQDREEEQIAAFNLAQTWVGTNEVTKSVPYLLQSSRGPDQRISADALYLAGTISLNQGDVSGAEYLDRFVRKYTEDPRREESLKMSVKAWTDSEENRKAVDDLSILIREFSDSPESDSYLFFRGELLLEIGDESAALSDFAALAGRFENSSLAAESHSRIGFVYAGRGQFVRAAGHYMDAADSAGGARGGEAGRRALYSAGVAYFNGGELQKASAIFKDLVDVDPSGPWGTEAAYHLGEARYEIEDYPGARSAYAMAAEHGEGQWRFDAFYGIAWTWYRQSNWLEAETGFEKAAAAALTPEDRARSVYRVGLSRASAERWQDAIASYDDALAEGRGAWREEALYQKAWALLNIDDGPGADEIALMLQDEFPDSRLPADLPFRMGENAMAAGDFEGAIRWYDKTVRDYPDTEQAARAHLRAALAAEESGDAREAADRYGRWVLGNIDDSASLAALRSWAQALLDTGDPELAQYAMDRIMELGENRLDLVAPIALAWTRISGIPEESVEYLESIVESDDIPAADRAEALLLRAHRYRRDGKPKNARQVYEVLIRDVPGRIGAEAQEGLAGTFADEGKVDQAAEAYLAVPYLFPEQRELGSRALREAERLYREAGREDEADKIREQMGQFPNS